MALSLTQNDNLPQKQSIKNPLSNTTGKGTNDGKVNRIYRNLSLLLSIWVSFMWISNISVGNEFISINTVMENQMPNETPEEGPSSKYAYTWIVGSISDKDISYKGFLWDVLISAYVLRKHGSTADFWVYTRLSPDSNLTDLPAEDKRLFHDLGFKVKQLHTPKKESFAQLVYDKFLTLSMTDYKRVMFLDADIVPLTNLDYLFHLSDPDYMDVPTLLKPNFIMATKGEPCNTAMFIVEPSKESFEKYEDVVRRQHEIARTLPYPHFDRKEGWGVNFRRKVLKKHNYWESYSQNNTHWRFHAGHSDQGLMYYLMRFVLKEFSVVIGNKHQNWSPSEKENNDEADIESVTFDALAPYEGNVTMYQNFCNEPKDRLGKRTLNMLFKCHPPYSSFAHYSGKKKPWVSKQVNYNHINSTMSYQNFGVKNYYFKMLNEISNKYDMGIDVISTS